MSIVTDPPSVASAPLSLSDNEDSLFERADRSDDDFSEAKAPPAVPPITPRFADNLVGHGLAMGEMMRKVSIVAPLNSTVLLLGETGTGKELIARAIHNLSSRRDRPYIRVNCAAIPAGLIESELFGHERGAFTGAVGRRTGRFEMAHGGTLFLDEIGDIPPELQPKLLRVLQEQEFERLGGAQTTRVDVRVVAATSSDLRRMVANREFRADLYYRLNVFPLRVPPLRERSEDIPLLVRHFVTKFSARMNRPIEIISSDVMDALASYDWPGNVRELQNFIERSVILSSNGVLSPPLHELEPQPPSGGAPSLYRTERAGGAGSTTLRDVEREHILQTLRETQWVVGGPKGAAVRLGLNRTTLIFRMRKLGIFRPGVG
jgi:formate hydrogenlyase transcriptional activator